MGQDEAQQSTQEYDSSSQLPPQTDSDPAPADATQAVEQRDVDRDDHAMQHDQHAVAEGGNKLVTETEIEPTRVETFKVPGLPARPPPQVHTPSLPADMAHIVALGANQPEAKDTDARGSSTAAGGPSREIADVVKELKAKATMQVDSEMSTAARSAAALPAGTQSKGEKSDELVKVEREMEMMGVKREPASDGIAEAEEGEAQLEVDGASRQEDVKMDGNASSSDSDTDSSSSDSDSTTAAPVTRQRQRRGRNQRATSPSSDMADDDDDESGVVSSKTAPKTEHEITEPEVALPAVQKIDKAVELAKFGKVESVIENVVVIRADTGGDWRVLDEGTVVCLEDRAVIGQIFETFGSVQQPFYSIRFPAAAPPDPSVFTIGRPTFYAPNLASFVFTRDLRAMKGSDASNIWDEEVAAHEMEFSDDEEEAEYRRRQKAE
ncbi:hypothetical protein BMF94_4412 [Rhodotorula taiwanensis]|uniref:H/ACA ribonucleoprotein complex non-core subunit NAF1 n=1 Tax=Rhodotorula taiwanensis TaxID=741276 RepID=A0A2S5B753_9BASI|nr:hypothetical protein BMF94_4412 [Rhodotorula taiwanensis]